jgi:hypothetical protein
MRRTGRVRGRGRVRVRRTNLEDQVDFFLHTQELPKLDTVLDEIVLHNPV